MIVVLPSFLRGLISGPPDDNKKRNELEVDARCLRSLEAALRLAQPKIAERCWNIHGKLNGDIVLVLNDELVPKGTYDDLVLTGSDELRILTQFAGG